jgi:hypothetical protein
MKRNIILLAVALVIWWFFIRKPEKHQGSAGKELHQYFNENDVMCDAHTKECEEFINKYVTFDGGPAAFRKLHAHIDHHYRHHTSGLISLFSKNQFKPGDMVEYIERINKVPNLYVDEMSEMYKKYTIPESVRTNHMNMINSQHDRRVQKENKWYKIMEPFIKK